MESQTKQPKISVDEFKELVRSLPEVREGIADLPKHWAAYKDLRYAFALLREVGFDSLSDAQLESLLVDQLGLYPKVPGARKNLRKQIIIAKKIATTSN